MEISLEKVKLFVQITIAQSLKKDDIPHIYCTYARVAIGGHISC